MVDRRPEYKAISFSLDKDLIRQISYCPNRSSFVADAIRHYLSRAKPLYWEHRKEIDIIAEKLSVGVPAICGALATGKMAQLLETKVAGLRAEGDGIVYLWRYVFLGLKDDIGGILRTVCDLLRDYEPDNEIRVGESKINDAGHIAK